MPSRDDLSAGPTRTGSPSAPAVKPVSTDGTPTIQPAEQVARFHVLGCVGTGGMGQVYAAYDPKLDRKVALKVLHEGREQGEQLRLVREAQALARLSHPNVVAVHDVGTHGRQPFVAMEFVEGVTLREWLRLHPPGPAQRVAKVLELLIQAGEGLAAAHRAGLVHRDFKPSNVLIGHDGRVRVVDFGVVRVDEPREGSRPQHLELAHDEETTEPRLDAFEQRDPLTRPGALVGTPAYMAPEQLLSMKVGPSSDLFAYCLSVWEAIFGVRPFPGKTIPAVLEAIRRGRPVRPPEIECPPELEAALLEGLSFGSRARQPSMDVLVDALRLVQARLRGVAPPAPTPAKRWPWLGATLLAGAAATAGLVLTRGGDSQLCSGAESRLAGAWDEAVAAELEQAFLRTEASFAPEAWARFERELDGYAQAWAAGHRDACEAAQVRKEQSTELMDLRMACLDAHRRELAALTEVYATPDADMIARTDEALEELGPLDACADPEHVRRRGSLPEGSEAAAEAEAALEMAARTSALRAAGRYVEALEAATEAVARASELDMAAVAARAHLQLGKVHVVMHQAEAARDALEWAYLLAKQADVPEVAFEASRTLVLVSSVLLSRFSEGRWWARVARFEAEAVDETDAARLQIALGTLARTEGRFQDASDHYEEAVALVRRSMGPEHLAYANALLGLGHLRLTHGGPDQVFPVLDEAMVVAEHELGPEHPSMAHFHTTYARAHRLRGDLDLASNHVERALRLSEDAFGPAHAALYEVLEELSNVLQERGETDRAIAALERARTLAQPEPLNDVKQAHLLALEGDMHSQQRDFRRAEEAYRRAMELSRSAVGEFHPQTVRSRIGLGATLSALGRRQEGAALIETGLAAGEAALGGQHPNVGVLHDMLATEMERAGDFEKALEHIEKSLRISAAAFGSDALPLLNSHGNMCAVLGHLRRTDEAVEHCRKALEIAERAVSLDDAIVAKLHNNLGAALVAAKRYDEAVPHYRDAHRIWERLLGPRHIMVGIVLANLAEIGEVRGQLAEAYEAYAESLAIREERLGPDDPMVIVPLVGMAHVTTERGEPEAAVALARRAVAVATKGSAPELVLARAEEALAHALWKASADRKEAIELASRARRAFEQAGAPAEADRARLAKWFSGEARR